MTDLQVAASLRRKLLRRRRPVLSAVRRTYRTAVEWWLAGMLVLPVVGGVVALASALVNGTPSTLWLGGGALLFHLLIRWSVAWPIEYGLGDDGVRIRDARMNLHIPFDRLTKAELSSDPMPSPALSLERIRIEYKGSNGRTFVLISPPDRAQFLADLTTVSTRHRLVDGKVIEAR